MRIEIPGREALEVSDVVFDVNGTLTERGVLQDGVAARISELREHLAVHLLSADTYGTLPTVATELGVEPRFVATGQQKVAFLRELGVQRCAAVGNGSNDVEMLKAAALGIAVVGPEGAAGAAVRVADIVCRSIVEALDLLLDERALVATLRI